MTRHSAERPAVWRVGGFQTHPELNTVAVRVFRNAARRPTVAAAGRLFLSGHHNANASAVFGGSFAPILRFEKLEIHKVFLRFPNLALTKNLSPPTLVD